MDWKHDLLWNKSKVNAYTAHQQDKTTHFFPLWCSIALETLSRAALAFVHPSLLADPTKGSNILYVFGYYNEKEPAKSVPMKTVLDRLTKIIEPFTTKEYDICMNFMERRNRELHSGGAAFEDYPTKVWLADFYRICNILITFQKKEMKDWLSDDDAKIALEMIKKDHNKIKATVKKLITTNKDEFYRKSKADQKTLREKAEKSHLFGIHSTRVYSSHILCPACKSKALISGQIARTNEPTLDGDEIVRQISILPTEFICWACELKLSGYDQLQAADLGGYINQEERFDAKEYYDFDPVDFYEPDYGND
jgi:hypothetical protein